MTRVVRQRASAFFIGACALALTAGSAWAGSPKPLSDRDVRAYAMAFAAADQGDFVGAQIEATEIEDKSLVGYLSYRQLMHPTAHKASFEELTGWLARFRDLPIAEKIFSVATKRKPADAADPPRPEVAGVNSARSEATFPARDAFYSGDVRRAYDLAVAVGDRWIAGLSAYRLRDHSHARDYFAQIAADPEEDAWLRAGAAFWAGRSAAALGEQATAMGFFNLAAQSPQTFYGMIAARQVQLASAATGELVLASYRAPAAPARSAKPAADLAAFVAAEPRAHRAAALVQIGRIEEARQELRAGLALARSSQARENWQALIDAIAPRVGAVRSPGYATLGDYPTPPLEPQIGFTFDRALVYAIVRQESRFNPQAVSPVGAIGLMQVMPETAAIAFSDNRLKQDPKLLLDPGLNLRIGQDYLNWLAARGMGYDLFKLVAAYNGGPGAVLKAMRNVGDDDPLMLIESLPALETRDYVEKVMAGYWTYKKIFGEDPRSLDALASGARTVDLRLDLTNPRGPQPQMTAQTLQVGSLDRQRASALD